MEGERNVAGLWCSEVLAALPDVVEGTLAQDRLQQVQAHLKGCRVCEQFGGRYSAVVGSVRAAAATPAPDAGALVHALLKQVVR